MLKQNIYIISHSTGGDDIGPNKRVFLLGKNLSKQNPTIIYASQFFHKYLIKPNKHYQLSKNLHIFYLPNIFYKNFLGQFINQIIFPLVLYFKLVNDFKKLHPDVIILSSPPPFAMLALIPILNSLKKPIKLIVDVRDLWPEILFDLHKKSFLFSIYLRIIKNITTKMYNRANHIISVKEGDLNYIKDSYETNAKFHFVPNAYTEEACLIDNTFRNHFIENQYFLVTYAGALSSYYTLHELIEVAKKCVLEYPKIKFIVAGGGKDLELYKSKSKNLSNISFIGKQNKAVINYILSKSTIAYLPLKENKFNKHGISTNKLFDYMFHSLPVLGMYDSDFDIVEKFQFGLVEKSYSPTLLFKKLIMFYEMSTREREKMGTNGKKLLEAQYLPNSVSSKFENIINA